MNDDKVFELVKSSIKDLYSYDSNLIDKDLCERCLVHRIAVYLEQKFQDFKVDCEFNKSFYEDVVSNKILSNLNGNYVDIIVHKRSNVPGENLLCFEIKKSSNYFDRKKDRENLRILTALGRFEYRYGFYVILGKTFESTKVEVYIQGTQVPHLI